MNRWIAGLGMMVSLGTAVRGDVPAILAGGGFRHGQHLAFNKPMLESIASRDNAKGANAHRPQMGVDQVPLCNLFVSLLQRAGIETDRFGASTGTLTGLELA